jgi:hypothetical protein
VEWEEWEEWEVWEEWEEWVCDDMMNLFKNLQCMFFGLYLRSDRFKSSPHLHLHLDLPRHLISKLLQTYHFTY